MITTRKNFTLLELSVVLLIIVSLASFLASQGLPIVEKTIGNQFEKNVLATATGVVGDSSYRDYDGSVVPFGYLNDMGSFPYDISDLWIAPVDTNKHYSKRTFTINGIDGHLYGGWNGPYYQAANENLENRLRLEVGDFNDDDALVDNDDIKLYASGYPESEIIEYGERNFSKRTISISGTDSDLPVKVTIQYFNDGELQTHEQDISGSDDTTVDLPKGLCAFYGQLEIDYSVTKIVTTLPSVDEGDVLFQTGTNPLIGNVYTWNGSNYDGSVSHENLDVLYNTDENKYYLYEISNWVEKNVSGTESPGIIKTVKTDILLELK